MSVLPGYSSGQRGVTVNHMPYGFVGSNPAPGTCLAWVVQWQNAKLVIWKSRVRFSPQAQCVKL